MPVFPPGANCTLGRKGNSCLGQVSLVLTGTLQLSGTDNGIQTGKISQLPPIPYPNAMSEHNQTKWPFFVTSFHP